VAAAKGSRMMHDTVELVVGVLWMDASGVGRES